MKKVLTIILTIAVLMNVCFIGTVWAEEQVTPTIQVASTGVTRIEGEAASEIVGGGYKRNMKTDDEAYALSYSPVAVADGQEYYAAYVVNVEKAGDYSLSAVASKRSQTYTSDWTIYANTEENAVVSHVQGADVTTGWFTNIFNKFACGTIYLEAGVNTIYWKVNAKDAPDGKLQAALDYIELTAPETTPTPTPTPTPDAETSIKVSSTGVTRIEGEAATEIVGGGYKRNMKTDDEAYALSYSPVAVADGQEYYATYVVNVEAAGDYSLNTVASVRSQTYTSDWTIYVNTEDNAVASYVQVAEVATGWYTNNFKEYACGSIYLEAGLNTIYWKVKATDAPDGKLQAALDYIELTPEGVTPPSEPTTPPSEPTPPPVDPEDAISVSMSEITRLEGENATEIVGGGYSRNMKTDDGAYALSYSPVAVADGQEYYAKFLVDVEVAGNYSLNTVASVRSQTYTSDWTIYVNTEDNAVASYVQVAEITTGWYTNNFKEYACGTIYLEAGLNTIYWKVKATDAPDGKLQAALDYIQLTPPPVVKISSTEATRIEGEAASEIVGGGYKRNMKTDDEAYALSYSPVAVADGQEYYAAYVVNVEKAGDYSLSAVASKRSQTYTSDWTIYANTEDNAVVSYVQGADVTTGWFTNIFNKFACGTIYLEKGINTIYWKVKATDAPDGKLQAALDYIELTPTFAAEVTQIVDVKVLDGTLTATISGESVPVDAKAYVAVYEDAVNAKLKSAMDAEINGNTITQQLTVSNGNVVKVFLWYSDSLKPICGSSQIVVQ